MPFVESQGVKLYAEETGSGFPIVFVHEFGSDYREWETQVRCFSRSYRCITYNARGYPPSDVPDDPGQYGWELAVADIAAVMRSFDIVQAHLVGLSMGGYAVLQFGLRYPEMARSLVAAGAGSGSPPSIQDAWREGALTMARTFREGGIAAMADDMGQGPSRIQLKKKDPRGWRQFMDHLDTHSAIGMANTMEGFQATRPSLFDFREQFSSMRIPVLLAVGDEDAPCIETSLMLKQTIPGAGLWMCPNTGHGINLEEPAAFNEEVQKFLSAVERGSWRRT
jgi:pimeloyl-ACP methyl ester carboxylesterase